MYRGSQNKSVFFEAVGSFYFIPGDGTPGYQFKWVQASSAYIAVVITFLMTQTYPKGFGAPFSYIGKTFQFTGQI